MQPPPVTSTRKQLFLKTLKHVHTEQIARLQAKNQHECDLLEDIRNFTKQRSVIEKAYAESLLKVSSHYLNKKIPSIPDLRDEDTDEEQWNVWNVWRTVLEENEKLARARLAAVEVFQQQITDDAKTIRHAKLQASKKCLDQLKNVQTEVQFSIAELDKNKKLYFEEEHMAHDARDRARDAEEKLKKKKGSIFSSFTSLQRSSVKFSSKKEAHEEKSTGARNEYLLALAVANAHQDRYFNVDLDGCLRTLEGDVYDKLKEYLTVLGRTELLTCSAAQNSFSKIRDQAQMLSRDYNVMCCVQYYPVLKQHIRYPFEPADGDRITKITCAHGAGSILSREAKKWATKIGKELKVIRENQKRLFYLQQLKDAGHKSEPDDPNGPDLDIKIDEIKENIRKAETEKIKAEGVIECLRDGNVNVDEFMQDIENLTTTVDIPRSSSSNSITADTSGVEPIQQAPIQDTFYDSESNDDNKDSDFQRESIDHDEDIEAHVELERMKIQQQQQQQQPTWEPVDWGDDGGTAPTDLPIATPPTTASDSARHPDSWPTDHGDSEPGVTKVVALYSYAAQNPDELSILENEHLDLIGEGDGDGWVRARNYKGEEGYVPQNYVEQEGGAQAAGYPLQPQISFSSVDYHIQDTSKGTDQDEDLTTADDTLPQDDLSSAAQQHPHGVTNGYPEPPEDFSQKNGEVQPATVVTTSVSSGGTTPFINELRGEPEMLCRALYDYEATAPEELSFYEGQIIKVLRTVVHDDVGDDDGWWEGEYDGIKGLFPSIVVEECRWDGSALYPDEDEEEEEEEEEEESEAGGPPAYTPPEVPGHLLVQKVIVTQPTPETEAPANQKTKSPVSYNYDKSGGFEIELNRDQQQKYQTQFGEDGEPVVGIVVSEVPDVQVTITEPENEIQEETETQGMDSGLDVAQIVITAATPMTDDSKDFPAISPEGSEEDGDQNQEPVSSSPSAAPQVVGVDEPPPADEQPPPPPPPQEEFASFADFGNTEFTEIPPAAAPPTAAEATNNSNRNIEEAFKTSTPEEPQNTSGIPSQASSQDSDSSRGTVQEHELPTPPPQPSHEKEISSADESLSSSNKEAKKSSLEIEDTDNHTRISPVSHESPVTPEELDVINLAKLDSLKESDA